MPVNEAIILAGGLGTRLKSAVPHLPKCMAPIRGKPFIGFVISNLLEQGIQKFIFSLGYRSDAFLGFLAEHLKKEQYTTVVEREPLGTGGAVQLSCLSAKEEQVLVLNGDSIFKTDIQKQASFHIQHDADCTLGLKYLRHFDRYGAVVVNPDHTIASFREKQFYAEGFINGGIYMLNRNRFLAEGLPEQFSFETDYVQAFYQKRKMYGLPQDAYFIDIGIPEDYQRAQTELI
jgi:D-glycero-alpha-D-manno-heptose 1-phosphate guanylyltransferase